MDDAPPDALRPGPDDGPRPPPPGAGPRASDADRDRFAATIERHFAEGRLSGDEFSDRMDRVLGARTLGELYALVADLPDLPAVDVPRSHRSRPRPWRFWRP